MPNTEGLEGFREGEPVANGVGLSFLVCSVEWGSVGHGVTQAGGSDTFLPPACAPAPAAERADPGTRPSPTLLGHRAPGRGQARALTVEFLRHPSPSVLVRAPWSPAPPPPSL